MTPEQKKIREILDYGYALDFGSVFETAFNNYKKTAIMIGVAILILMIIFIAIAFGISILVLGASFAAESYVNYNYTDDGIIGILVMLLIGAIFSGLSSPLTAGFIHMVDNAHNKKEVNINNIFKFYKHEKFKDLFLYGVILGIISVTFSTLATLVHLPFLNILTSLLISLFTCLAIPLIIYSNNNASEALQNSISLVAKSPFIIAALLIVATLFSLAGFLVICIGVLFTLPFIYAMYHSIYIHIVPPTIKDELDEIGSLE